jgi:hypothetical protein
MKVKVYNTLNPWYYALKDTFLAPEITVHAVKEQVAFLLA